MTTFRSALLVVAVGTLLTACATPPPATLDGLKGVFHDPGFAVQGKTRKDQVWVSSTQETGIRVLGWARPRVGHAASVKVAKASKPAARTRSAPAVIIAPRPLSETVAAPVPLPPPPKKTQTERLKDEVNSLNERIRKLEGK